jgi:UDP-glucose 4-epimerase
MKCIVTGCSGFIGRHLSQALVDQGHFVIGIDKKPFPRSTGLDFIQADISYEGVCDSFVKGADVVFHLASQVDVEKSVQYPVLDMKDTLQTTVNVLNACIKAGSTFPRFVLASSASVYGGCDKASIREEDSIGAVLQSPYAIHKSSSEDYAQMYSLLYPGFSTVCLRYFNVYGPGQENLRAVIPAFITGALSEEKVVVRGDGLQTRDFIYVEDVVAANILLGCEKKCSGVYNIGTGGSSTLLDILTELERALGWNIHIEYAPKSEWDIQESCACIEKIEKEGWNPKTDLKEGLAMTVDYYERFIK